MDLETLEKTAARLFRDGAVEASLSALEAHPALESKRLATTKLAALSDLFRFDEALAYCEACGARYPAALHFPLKSAELLRILSQDQASSLRLDQLRAGGHDRGNWGERTLWAELLAQHRRFDEMLSLLDLIDAGRKRTAKWSMLRGRALAGLGRSAAARAAYAQADEISAETAPDCVTLVAHPKAGFTWARYILVQILAARAGLALPHNTVRLPQVGRSLTPPVTIRATHDGASIRAENGLDQDVSYLERYDGRERYRTGHVILIVRDPRDTIVSLYHQLTKRTMRPLDLSLSEFIRSPQLGWDRMMRFHRVWEANLSTPRSMLLLSYEGLLRRPADGVAALAGYMGCAFERSTIDRIVTLSSADRMRDGERKGEIGQMRAIGAGPDAFKVRKAKAGGFSDEMSAADQAWCANRMSQFPSFFKDLVDPQSADIALLGRPPSTRP